MAGRVLGKHFREVIGPLLDRSDADKPVLTRIRAELEAIDPASERPWEEYVATLTRVADTVRNAELVAVGERVVLDAKPVFEQWGFDTAEKVLTDWDAPWGSFIIDVPQEQSVITLKYQPGQAYLRAGATLPLGLVEGYIRGLLRAFGDELLQLLCHRVAMDGRPYHLFDLRWRGSPVARSVARRGTDRMVLGLRPGSGVPQKVA